MPEGQANRRDYGKVLCISTTDGSTNSYEYGRTNPTGYDIGSHYIAVVSNLNDKCYIDCIDRETKEVTSMDVPEGIIIYEVIFCNNNLYGISSDLSGKIHLCRCDISESKITNLMVIEDDEPPGFLQTNEKDIFFIVNNKLAVFDTSSNSHAEKTLPRENAFNLKLSKNILWVAYTDIYTPESSSCIEGIDLETMDILYSQKIEGSILQIEDDGDRLMLRGYNKLLLFEYNQNGLHSISEVSCNEKDYFVGCCFLARGGRQ